MQQWIRALEQESSEEAQERIAEIKAELAKLERKLKK
jgi:predicted translin family RNA/ssDNA-binding protein